MNQPLDHSAVLPIPTLRQAIIGLPLLVLVIYAVFVPVPAPLRNGYTRALFDFCHFSWAAAACWFFWIRLRWPGWAAFLAVVAAAGLCEIIQGFTGRSPHTSDFIRGVFGAAAVATFLSAYGATPSRLRWIAAAAVVTAVSAWPISEFLAAAARFCALVGSIVG